MNQANLVETILAHLPPSLKNGTDEQALALAEAQVRATLALVQALGLIEAELTYLRQSISNRSGEVV